MRILLIHDADEARARVVQAIVSGLPQAVVEMWDPTRRGLPDAKVDWGRFDLVFVDQHAEEAEAQTWLRGLHAESSQVLPPFVVLAETSDPDRVEDLRQAGAFDCIARLEVNAGSIERIYRAALGSPMRLPAPASDVEAAQRLATSGIEAALGYGRPVPPGYRVLRKIADGGMSKVYLAERTSDALVLVLKMIDPRLHKDPLFRQRFVREYKLLAKISNEHVVAILDQGMTDEYGYIATEYFSGGDLKARIRSEGMPRDAVLSAIRQIAAALDAVHSAGIIHRDLKPQNIMYRDDERLALVDFGLAREMDGSSTLTQQGIVLATPLYMSPEQCLGIPLDGRSDLYSAGVLVYEMLTGRPPYVGQNAPELAYHHVHSPVPRLPPQLLSFQPLIERLLEKDPEDRFPTARSLLEFIESEERS